MSNYSIAAEQSVLGEILVRPEKLEDAVLSISYSDFYKSENREIFKAMQGVSEKGIGIDSITLESCLPTYITTDYIDSLKSHASSSMFEDHLNVIHGYSFRRKVVSSCEKIQDAASSEEKSPTNDLVSLINTEIGRSLDHAVGNAAQAFSYNDMMNDYLGTLKYRAENGEEAMGVTTGIDEFDEMTYGFKPADMIVLAARPSMGKTALALNIVENECASDGRVLVFSMEMPKEQLLQRSIASIGRIDQSNLQKGQLTQLEQGHLARAVDTLKGFDVIIDDQGGLTMSQVRSRAIRAHREKPLTMIMIDYLQLMKGESGKGSENRTNEIGEISRGIKQLAKELNIPIIALSQLNRSLEQRQNKRPINSDLRESGSIEQDADVIMFIYRDEVYNEDSTEKGIAEIIIGKQRNGPLGTARARFIGRHSKFENIEKVESIEEGSLRNSNGLLPS